MDYNFEIIFKQGKMNTNADALSRIKIDIKDLIEMIPNNEEKQEQKDNICNINIITRGMIKRDKFLEQNSAEVTLPSETNDE